MDIKNLSPWVKTEDSGTAAAKYVSTQTNLIETPSFLLKVDTNTKNITA